MEVAAVADTGVRDLAWPAARAAAARVDPLPAVRLTIDRLAAGAGASLAEPLRALVPVPSFDNAAMDGYAVRGAGPWRVVARVLAGSPPPPALAPGTAVEVATGAALPPAAEGVLPVEQAVRTGATVTGPHPRGRHLRRAGEECAAGDELLPAGARLTAAAVGLAAAVGCDTVLAHPRPRVVALVTGDELEASGLPGAGRVRDAVGPLLPALVAAHGGVLVEVRAVGDAPGELDAALTAAAVEADVVVTTGASSVGPTDGLRAAVADGVLVVDGVAARPGHPTLLARWRGVHVVGLPGNPLAALAGAATVLEPLLAGLGGLPAATPVRARSGAGLGPHPTAWRLVPVLVTEGRADATGHAAAGMLRGAALATHLAVVPPGTPVADVDLLPLP